MTREELKANKSKVDMLKELHAKIEKVPKYRITHNDTCVYRNAEEYISDINDVIQQEIDALESESEG